MAEDKAASVNFITRILNIFHPADPEAEKKRLLKSINKELVKAKVKFYKYNSGEALPQMAKFFFDVYKIVGPAQILFQNTPNPNTFKNMVIDFYLSDSQKDLLEKLQEESILERSQVLPLKELAQEVKNNLSSYNNEFDSEKIALIDGVYKKLSVLISFCTFDYYFLLKKFDSHLQEQDFTYSPRFEFIRAEYIIEDLKDFTAIAWALPLEDSWNDVFTLLKEYRGVQPIPLNPWNRLMQRLRKYRDAAIFEMIIQLVTKDPGFQTVVTSAKESIIDAQLDKVRKSAESVLQKIQNQRKNSKIDELLNAIYGTTAILKLKNYSETGNQAFTRRGLQGYTLHLPLNYLKAFLLDYYKKYVREFADLVLVRGQWVSSVLSNPMSESYHSLLDLSDKITDFDNILNDTGELGIKLKTYLTRSERDTDSKNILNSLLRDINEKAYKLLSSGTQNLVVVAKTTKDLLEDMNKKKSEMVINWTELSHFADQPIKEMAIGIYKKIYLFLSLMKFFLNTEN